MPFSIEFYYALLAVFAAGVMRGFSGFGAGMVLVPCLSILYSPIIAVITVVLLEIIPAVQLLASSIKHCHWREILPMSLAAVITIPLGSLLLVTVDENIMRMCIAVLVISCVVILASGWRFKGDANIKTTSAVGLASGLISGATSLGGLPVVLYFLSGKHSATVARASMVVFLVFTAVVALITYLSLHIISTEIMQRTAWFVPVFIIAIGFGGRLFGKVSDVFFKKVMLMLLGSVGIVMLFT